ncbi:hypothetical protein ESP50_12350 [Agromyces atrinae]|uniref:Uncharacterized protein n=2 Tax=Agromyces atrinae TaxID=592376 RepID=A0A4Q2M6U1_9MICO|nr:hypothetical protein ESP50_12350 [Agromyces atrinae]
MTMPDRRARVLARYRSLGSGELFAAAVFAFLAWFAVAPWLSSRESLALVSALVPLLVVLVQAGVYWLLARAWVGRGSMPTSLARLFGALRIFTAVLLAIGLVGVIAWWPSRGLVAALILGVWAFGVVEYINYFVVQLARPISAGTSATNWLRTPRLVRDMRAAGR